MDVSHTSLQLDPRSKLLLLVLANVVAFTYQQPWAELTAIGLLTVLLIACGCGQSAVKWLAAFGCLVAVQYLLLPVVPRLLAVILTILTVFARRIFPCMMMGSLIIQTTPVRHLILALRKWHVPQSVIIPLAVTLRYFPAIGEEHRHIRDAMKLKQLRGLGRRLEYTMLPLLVSAIRTSDELSAAAITRGIENPCPKTSAIDLRFHIQDWLCLAVGAALAFCTIFFA